MSVVSYEKELKSVGIADTRAYSIALALNNLHAALSQLDNTNLDLMKRHNPGAVDAATTFAEASECLRKFN